jgi:hypothetical protein
MKRFIFLFIPFSILCFCFAPAGKKWRVNGDQSRVTFILPAAPSDSGHFTKLAADIVFDSANLKLSSIKAVIDVNSIFTGDEGKNAHLLSADFFNAAKQIKNVIKKINVPFRFKSTAEGGVFAGEMHLFAGDFGVMKKSKTGADKVVVYLDIPVTKE